MPRVGAAWSVVCLLVGCSVADEHERSAPAPQPPPDASVPATGDGGANDAPPGAACIAPGAVPDGRPHEDYVLDGERLFARHGQRWSWHVSGGPCDQMFDSLGQPTSFTLLGADTPQLTIHPTQVGDYTVHVAVDGDAAAESFECTFSVHVVGAGLRIELCWPTMGVDDLDLHVHRPGTRTDWFDSNDDCYYFNCSAAAFYRVSWGSPSTAGNACFYGDIDPSDLQSCPNPRLDQQDGDEVGHPEYTDIDLPDDGATYRVMVNYFGGAEATFPMANIYCQGRLISSFGGAPDEVPGFQYSGGNGFGSMWRVADVTTHVDAAHVTTCDVAPIHPPGQASGFDVRRSDVRY